MATDTATRPLATVDEFCRFAGITTGHAAQMRYTGTGPEFVKITGRKVRYRWSAIEKWVETRTQVRTDQRADAGKRAPQPRRGRGRPPKRPQPADTRAP